MITHYHILIGGFHQHRGDASNGLSGVRSDLLHKYGRGNGLSDVNYLPWYTSADHLSRYIHRNGDFRGEGVTKLQVAGYSYGGTTAVNLCSALQDLGIQVQELCLIDPVKRRSIYPWGWLASLNRWAKIEVTANVQNLHWFHQSTSWPRSHAVMSHKTTAITSHKLMLRHSAVDNIRLVRDTIMDQAAAIHI